MLDRQLEVINDAVTQVAKQYPNVRLLMSQPGVGAVTAFAFVSTVRRCSLLLVANRRPVPGIDPSRAFIGRKAAHERDQQAGQPASAISFI